MMRAPGNSPQIAIIASTPFISGICKSMRVYVRTMDPELFDGLAPVGSLGNQCHIRLASQECGHTLTQKRMIIYRENANRGPISAHEGTSRTPRSLECAIRLLCPRLLRSTFRVARRCVQRA